MGIALDLMKRPSHRPKDMPGIPTICSEWRLRS